MGRTPEHARPRRRWAALGRRLAASVVLAAGCHAAPQTGSQAPGVPAVTTPEVAWESFADTGLTNPGVVPASAEEMAPAEKADAVPVVTATVPPAVPAAEREQVIDLASALRLAGADNPTINLASEVVREAAARYTGARALLLPSLTGGMNFHWHTGVLQASPGIIRDVTSGSFYAGAGARTLAAESVAFPGVRIFSHLGDAIYEPLAARQNLGARRATAAATENRLLLDVAAAYFALVGAELRLEALRRGEAELAEVVRLTTAYAKEEQGRRGDANRAIANAELVRRQVRESEGEVAASSARLTGLLSLDPSLRLRSPGGDVEPVTLIDENEQLEDLVRRALRARPELLAQSLAVAEARTRVRQERTRPLFPLLSVGYSAGTFGGGSNLTAAGLAQAGGGTAVTPFFGNFNGRSDFDVFAVWQFQNVGLGNRALTKRAEAVVGEATAELEVMVNEVRAQVAEALAEVQSSARQLDTARAELARANEGAREEMTRIRKTIGRPLETLDSIRQQIEARQELLRAVVAYNAAQYRLLVAVGASPLRPALDGDGVPCDRP
jgi:outer membrane protein TolC